MATSAKANPKVVPIDDGAAAAPAKKTNKKLFMFAGAAALLLAGAGGGWFFLNSRHAATEETHVKAAPPAPPVYTALDPFTVNLQPEAGDQYLQVGLTVQVADQEQVEQLKLYMPLVRSRVLMLLTSKKPSEISSSEGKENLQKEILAQLKQPFAPHAEPLAVNGVFFTSFVIQ